MECELCGKKGMAFDYSLEGSVMKLCKACGKYGERVKKARPNRFRRRAPRKKEDPNAKKAVISNYAKIIRDKREKMGIRQEDLARKLAEKSSLLQKLESGSFKPSLALAQKMERILNITLIEELKDESSDETSQEDEIVTMAKRSSSSAMTIGDLIKFKKK